MKLFERIEENKKNCVNLVTKLAEDGKKIYGYGASTKGNTILQYYGLDSSHIKGIAEIHPNKIGKYTVGTNIPIIHETEAKKDADFLLVLPFAFRDYFIKREEKWLNEGGKFIFSTPNVEVYEA